jgi:hypothetical protein
MFVSFEFDEKCVETAKPDNRSQPAAFQNRAKGKHDGTLPIEMQGENGRIVKKPPKAAIGHWLLAVCITKRFILLPTPEGFRFCEAAPRSWTPGINWRAGCGPWRPSR